MIKIVVKGRPCSIQASTATRQRWMEAVRAAGQAVCNVPLTANDLRIKITFFYNTLPDFDTDNVSKPICDALNGVAYTDDHQLAVRVARRRDIDSPYRIRGVHPDLAVAIAQGDDFVWIEIDQVTPDEAQQL